MHRVALGDQETTLRLNLHENHREASLIDSDWEGVLSKKPVPVRRLDSIVAELKLPPADVIKMDTQGFELKILQGDETTFAALRLFSSRPGYIAAMVLRRPYLEKSSNGWNPEASVWSVSATHGYRRT
jgi:hypothetical protein